MNSGPFTLRRERTALRRENGVAVLVDEERDWLFADPDRDLLCERRPGERVN